MRSFILITEEIINRINELAKKKKTVGLTDEELTEQTKLRRIYIDNIKIQLKNNLENIEFVDNKPTNPIH
ncbi:MAG: Uncharacterized protein YnzC, family [Firmicutes bacterium]|nr:Uncharacterized protein YnzC, family [Bacillota bacterium]